MSASTTSLPANTNSSSSNNQTPIFLLSNISTYVTVKLDHSNFLTWKFQITHILEAYSLLEYVEGYNTCPPKFLVDELGAITTQVNSVYSQWQARDKALMSLISATLSPSAHSLIIGQSSAYGMWTVLLKRYTFVSHSNILNLKKQLHDVEKNTDTVTQYLQRIKESRDKLAAVGALVDDEDLLHIVLKGLPSEYESFSTAMLTKSEPVSFEELHVLMITQEELLKSSQENSKENSIMAMVANKGPSNPTLFNNSASRGGFHHRGRGNYNGYNASNGVFPQSFTQSNPNFSNPNPNRPTCQICYKQGHTALDCYNRMNFSYQGCHPPAKLAALASAAPPSPSTSCWISDTGATDHFTPDLGNLPDSSIYNDPQLVSVGNGQQLPISHIGNAQLYTSSYLFKLKNILRVPSMASNLLSINKFCRDNHYAFYFDFDCFHIHDRLTGKPFYKGLSRDGLYPLHGLSLPLRSHSSPSSSSTRAVYLHSAKATASASNLWHARFGHP
uniref:Retrovirus-related Pol polyprotein from transposon TNT 1-94-like beta-barrel domain-containing protein n=1 Tax=Fagus sylvatica TaxID=28930 RepID=A0A2N9F5W2_FAGSY